MTSNNIETKFKIKPENNRWYLLCTLYGEPSAEDPDLTDRNRIAWNCFMAAKLADSDRKWLINDKRCTTEELTPFSAAEMDHFKKAYSQRREQAGSTAAATIPDLRNDLIDFSNVAFDRPFLVHGYCFCKSITFMGASFSSMANFDGATFLDRVAFADTMFADVALFTTALFSREADFTRSSFSDEANFTRTSFFTDADFTGATFFGEAHLR